MSGLEELLAKATPGPWLVNDWDEDDRGWFVLGGGPKYSAAEHMVGAALPQPTEDSDSPRPYANARLIALAPDLARLALDMGEALRVIRETGYLDGHDELCTDDDPEYCDACALLARLDGLAAGKETAE